MLWTHAQTHSLRHSYRVPTQCVPVPLPTVPWLADQFINLKSVFDWLESKRTCMKLATGYEAKLGHSPQARTQQTAGGVGLHPKGHGRRARQLGQGHAASGRAAMCQPPGLIYQAPLHGLHQARQRQPCASV